MASETRTGGATALDRDRDGDGHRWYLGGSAIGYLLVTLIATGLIASTGTTEQQMERAAVDPFLPAIAAAVNVAVVSMLAYVLSMLLLLGVGVGLYVRLGDRSMLGLSAPVAVGVGATLFVMESLLTVGIILELAPAFVAASGTQRMLLGTSAATLLVVRSYTALTAGGLVALGVGLFGRSIVRTEVLSTRLGYLGIGIAGLGLVGVLWPLVPAISYLRQVAYILLVIWVAVVGVQVIRT